VNHFYPETHVYTVDGRQVPSVTQILGDVIGVAWQASDWYLQRGRAVHACCAMIARGEDFDNDPQIDGQVSAARRFFREVNPDVAEVETPHFAQDFAGTPDLVTKDGKIVDFKASFSALLPYQLAAYGILTGCRGGCGVELREDGSYRVSDYIRFDAGMRARWGSILAVWKIKKETGT
jgi:hypothetical protein